MADTNDLSLKKLIVAKPTIIKWQETNAIAFPIQMTIFLECWSCDSPVEVFLTSPLRHWEDFFVTLTCLSSTNRYAPLSKFIQSFFPHLIHSQI